MILSREDQRENNNLPKLNPPQNQGRMLVIDEASVASEILRVAKDLMAIDVLDDKLDKACGRLNSALGRSHTPGTSSCIFWSGNQSSSDNELYSLRTGSGVLTMSHTKDGLLKKIKRCFEEMSFMGEGDWETSWVEDFIREL